MPTFQSYGRSPQPVRIAGSYVLLKTGLAKFKLLIWPQKSPPVGRRSCASGLLRSQSGLKFLFASVHARVTDVEMRDNGFVNAPVIELPSAAARYLPMLNFTDVLPLPKTSYATPNLGVMSLYDVPACAANTVGVRMNGFGPTVSSGKKLADRS